VGGATGVILLLEIFLILDSDLIPFLNVRPIFPFTAASPDNQNISELI
jgi:hypothetical protein